VELTEPGHRAVEAAVTELLTYEQGLVDVLDPGQQEELALLLAALIRALTLRAAGQGVSAQDVGIQ
jgi:hypothetical protein